MHQCTCACVCVYIMNIQTSLAFSLQHHLGDLNSVTGPFEVQAFHIVIPVLRLGSHFLHCRNRLLQLCNSLDFSHSCLLL